MKIKKHSKKLENFYLRQIINNIPISIYLKDTNGFYIGCNNYVAKMAGLTSTDAIIGKRDLELSWAKFSKEIKNNDEQVIEHGQHIEVEEEAELANGDKITMLTNKIPLKDDKNNIIGVMGISVDISDRKRMEIELEVAYNKAEEMCKALNESQKYLVEANKKLQELSRYDSLTGLANRRWMEDFLAIEWPRTIREQSELSILMIDIDDFKYYNDTYGHLAGDEALKRVSAILKLCLRRPADLVARFGGEEFIVILPNTVIAGAQYAADYIRQQVENLHIPHRMSTVAEWLTISIGCASMIPREGDAVATLIASADTALYQAKNSGKNRISTAGCLCDNTYDVTLDAYPIISVGAHTNSPQ